jgi:hypothetical protein
LILESDEQDESKRFLIYTIMAKELPYFKFEPSEWDNGIIQMCSRESKGLFIDICACTGPD